MRIGKLATLLALTLLSTTFCVEEEDNVLVLTDANFDEELAKHEHLLVEFYAPWCGHCKKLAPEYAKAAGELRKLETPLYIAKVDATENKTVGGKYEVKGYPTLKFFVKGEPIEYNGGRTSSEIVSWLKKKTGPATKTMETVAAVESFASENEVVAVFLGKDEELFKTYKNFALSNEDIVFGDCASQECLDHYGLKAGNVVLLKKFDEKRNDLTTSFTNEDLKKFVSENSVKTVMEFDQKCAQHVFGGNVPGLFLYRDANAESTPALEEMFTKIANEFKGKIQSVITGVSEGLETRLAEYIGITSADLPSVRIADTTGNLAKYNMEGEITEENVRQFVNDWQNKKLKRSLKSEDIPSSQDEPVFVLVGKNFNDVVMDETKDVLVEFYAPWCGHCKKLAPIFDELAEKLKHNENLIIAKMDSTANETDAVEISGFPTLKFFRANDKKAKDFSGERTVEGFIKYLKENVHYPITEEPADKEEL